MKKYLLSELSLVFTCSLPPLSNEWWIKMKIFAFSSLNNLLLYSTLCFPSSTSRMAALLFANLLSASWSFSSSLSSPSAIRAPSNSSTWQRPSLCSARDYGPQRSVPIARVQASPCKTSMFWSASVSFMCKQCSTTIGNINNIITTDHFSEFYFNKLSY